MVKTPISLIYREENIFPLGQRVLSPYSWFLQSMFDMTATIVRYQIADYMRNSCFALPYAIFTRSDLAIGA